MADQYAVIGNPVAHSKSPQIHAEFARATGQDIRYGTILAPLDAFEEEVQQLMRAGASGANVTLPFKHRAYLLSQQRSKRAEHARAANTLIFRDGCVTGDNTDGVGLVRDLTVNLSCTLRERRILLMGAGGASYGVCGPLLEQHPAALTVANRTREKAVALCEHFGRLFPQAPALIGADYDALHGCEFDLVINATSAGLSGEMPALPPGLFARKALAYDMLYGGTTPFMQFAMREGAQVVDGAGMLVEQAAESFNLWRGIRPETERLIAQLRAAPVLSS